MIYTILVLITFCAIAGCSNEVGTEPLGKSRTFERSEVIISADTNRAITTKPITVTTECIPLIEGKGRLTLYGRGALSGSKWALLSPFSDTLINTYDQRFRASTEADFRKGKTTVQQWRVHLLTSETSYVFWADASIDSVYIEDSASYFPINSEIVRLSSPYRIGYDGTANTPESGVILHP